MTGKAYTPSFRPTQRPKEVSELFELADALVRLVRKLGADVAEAVLSEGRHLSAKVRLGEPELVEEASSRSIGVRAMIRDGGGGFRVAVSVSSDLTEAGISRLAEDVVELARLAEVDPFAGPPDQALFSSEEYHPELDLFDPSIDSIDAREAIGSAKAVEKVALGVDPRINNSEGAEFSRASGITVLVTSEGFRGWNCGTHASLWVAPVADDQGGKKQSASAWTSSRHRLGLRSTEEVGKEAAQRTLAKLGARKVNTTECPVIFEREAGGSLIGAFAGCVLGGAIWRKSSYLVDRLNTVVASPLVTIIDDPLILRGLGSRAFDGEGLLSRRNFIVEEGRLRTYLLDSYSARKLGMRSTGSASRSSSGGVSASTSNFILLPGSMTPEELIAQTERGFLVTEMMGFGFNPVTGDFSRGASGFWIEKGRKAFPVSEVTISGNLDQMLQSIDAIANDLDLQSSIAAPTFRIASMMVAGSGDFSRDIGE
ncbi:MAG: metallopeptidase TldD-related protein [Sandaracinaceae bacterium]|nr:metallopeptidase TldD-related protein [Sandaracinaceae bacterium]MDW8246995.1 metallopeptidase TldD-related protein [Sandaracinaceae bacterium]